MFDHPRCEGVGRLLLDLTAPNAKAVYRRLCEHRSSRSGCRVQLAVGIDAERQRTERLLNPCGFFHAVSPPRLAALGEVSSELGASVAAGRLRRADRARLLVLVRGLPRAMAALVSRARGHPYQLSHLALVEQLEQPPAEAGRLELAEERDRFGRRRLRVGWRVADETIRTQHRLHELLAARLASTGIGRLDSPLLANPHERPAYGDAGHPMGTTRMSTAPERGVVDPDCRVHALENLYVVGSSVFPTSGHANPTLTLVALAVRLADHLAAGAGTVA